MDFLEKARVVPVQAATLKNCHSEGIWPGCLIEHSGPAGKNLNESTTDHTSGQTPAEFCAFQLSSLSLYEWNGSRAGVVGASSGVGMSRLTTTGSCPLRTITASTGSSFLAFSS